MNDNNIAIFQILLPHYRTEFFNQIKEKCGSLDLYTCEKNATKMGFKVELQSKHLSNIMCHGICIYNPLPLIKGKYDTIVLLWHFAHLTTWLVLFTKWFHKKKVILWGQGISVKRYLKEEKKADWKLSLMLKFADGAWLYTENEKIMWRNRYPRKQLVALGNTISGVSDILRVSARGLNKDEKIFLKNKYKIKQEIIFIFCARFESNNRRTDLLLESIRRLETSNVGFVIIGAGSDKPDFSTYSNVYDFGAVYDSDIKKELFGLADAYYQPGWVGLSIVEAMAYGKAILTYKRRADIMQCVEYGYLKDNYNALLFNNVDEFVSSTISRDKNDYILLGNNARQYVLDNLSMERMSNNAISIL